MPIPARSESPLHAYARALVGLAVAVLAAVAMLLLPGQARAAGMTTHAWMADVGVDGVEDPRLRELLELHRDVLLSGASYPDSGYYLGSVYPPSGFGEVSHWERFINAYIAHIREKPECQGTLRDADGPCAELIAHALGSAAHGLGDETWDWMFESQMPDHGEHPHDRNRVDDQPGWAELGLLPGGSDVQAGLIAADEATLGDDGHLVFGVINSPEYNMDVAAIWRYGRIAFDSMPPPSEDLVEVYESIGRDDVNRQGIDLAWGGITAILAAERASILDYRGVERDMPWSSENMTTSQGGVEHSGAMISGYYDSLWQRLLTGKAPPLEVVGTAPFDGTEDVPTDWAGAQTFAGPHGDGDKRIIAVLNNGFDPFTERTLPGTMRLLAPDGTEVPARDDFPKTGPYGGDGVHSIAFFPAGDLEPCTTYTAEVTTALVDHAGGSLAEPYRWQFTTESADGSGCAVPEPPVAAQGKKCGSKHVEPHPDCPPTGPRGKGHGHGHG